MNCLTAIACNILVSSSGQTRADRDGLVDGWSNDTLILTKQGKIGIVGRQVGR